ncbi:hypothetical protein HY485_04910 [Candidatus Woesearchaeota archaeon]|nr:hypothetical protein [Candidatus Woesearchaeota archaeon]
MALTPKELRTLNVQLSPSEVSGADRIEKIVDAALRIPNQTPDCIEQNGEYTVYIPMPITTRLAQEVIRRYTVAGWGKVKYITSELSQWFKLSE